MQFIPRSVVETGCRLWALSGVVSGFDAWDEAIEFADQFTKPLVQVIVLRNIRQ